MKHAKFGKVQKQILRKLWESGNRGNSLLELYAVVFPYKEYTYSFLLPVIVRMEHQKLIRINWQLNRARLIGGKNVERALTDDSPKPDA